MPAIAIPHANLSVKLIRPYTKADASVLAPTKSAVSDKLVTSITAPPKPGKVIEYNFSQQQISM